MSQLRNKRPPVVSIETDGIYREWFLGLVYRDGMVTGLIWEDRKPDLPAGHIFERVWRSERTSYWSHS